MNGKIYIIKNDLNNKVYIGKTLLPSINDRFKEHLKDAPRRNFEKRPLYRAINKYGADHFYIVLLEECDISILSEREIYWINYYSSYSKGYNATIGGDGKPLYEKSLQFTSTSSADTYTTVAHNISNVDVIFITDAFVIGSTYTQQMSPFGGLTGNDWFQGLVSPTSFDYQVGSDFISCPVYVTLRYTKSA